jgi:predicted GNAT family N-acyltransferase
MSHIIISTGEIIAVLRILSSNAKYPSVKLTKILLKLN